MGIDELTFDAPMAEMETLESWQDIVKLDKDSVAEMTKGLGDDNPEFPVIRVEEGWSRNGRLWTAPILRDIAEQINTLEPVAHLGHIPDSQIGDALPDPQTVWLGATTQQEQSRIKGNEGKTITALYVKGYNLPGAKVRGFLKAKAVNSTSWKGRGAFRTIPGKGVEVTKFILNSLDWSRKNSSGMSAQFLGLAAEMDDPDNEGGNSVEIDWAKVTVAEIQKENPSLYAVLVAEMAVEKDEEIETLQEQVDGAKADTDLVAKLREAVGADADADLLEVIGTLMTKSQAIVKGTLNAHLEKILLKKVPHDQTRAAVMALLPTAEMETKLPTDKTDEETETAVSEMVDEAFDASDVIKGLVSEQSGSGHSVSTRRQELGDRNGDKKLVGMSESRTNL